MAFEFRPARREGVGTLTALAGASGSGKTYSALRMATGLAGDRPFCVIDTESGRAKHYAELFKFDHGDLGPPFTPERYREAIVAAEAAGYPVILIDSMSHEWAGDGGCCEMQEAEIDRMAGDNWQKREAVKIAAWIKPKKAHKQLVSRLLQCRAHLIFCLRAEPKVEVVRGPDGKMQVVPKRVLGWSSEWIPVAEKGFLFEMTTSFVLSPDKPGIPIPIKLQEQHRPFFPLDKPIGEESGQRLAQWARGSTATASTGAPVQSEAPRPAADGGRTSAVGPSDPRAGLLAAIQATITEFLPGTDDKAKAARAGAIKQVFGVEGWSAVAKLPVERLLAGQGRLETVCADFRASLTAA